MPNTEIVTVSQKITDKQEQQRLIKLVKENLSEGNGSIIRTSAEGKEKEIIDDIKNIEQSIKEFQDEKQRILKKENITNLSPVYECKFCNDTGYINKNGKTIMCHCLKQKLFNIQYNKSNIGNVEYENFSTFSSEFYSDEINPTKYGLNISPKENIEKIKKISENFIQNFDNPEEKNLLFTGDTRTW